MKRLILLMPVAFAMASAQPFCTMDTIRGTYIITYYGSVTITQPGAAALNATGGIVGTASINADGAVTSFAAVSGAGPVVDYEVAGMVQFTNNCTGTITMKIRQKGTKDWTGAQTDRFVVDPTGGLSVITVDLGPGMYPAMQGTWKKISAAADAISW